MVFAGALSGGSSTTSADETTVAPITEPTSTTVFGAVDITAAATTIPATTTTAPAIVKTALSRNLYSGVFGNDVKALQERLSLIGFAPGVADGAFGAQTQQAVWAYEKLVLKVPRDNATGKVTDEIWQGMQDAVTVAPRRPGGGTHVEIYLPEQVAVVFTDNAPALVIHISSGEALTNARDADNVWCEPVTINEENGLPLDEPIEEKRCGVSYTPGGVFRFTRAVEGRRVSALGGMYNPIYFNYGIAMHGADSVPLHPASHGCIRMHMTISQTFQEYVDIRDVVYVWGQDGKQPESYTKTQTLPVFDWKDPEWVKAQASTTTAPETTVKATTTTVKPAATTTTAKPAVTTTTAKPVPPTTTVAATQPPTTPAPVTAAPTTADP